MKPEQREAKITEPCYITLIPRKSAVFNSRHLHVGADLREINVRQNTMFE